jgi:hypothetical protein
MKLNLSYRLFVVTLSCLFLSSCFDLREKIYLKKDGSGTFSFTIDLAQSKLFLDMAKKFSDSDQASPTANLNSSFDKSKEELEAIKGITNVRPISDEKNYIFGIQFDFANISALNLALEKALIKDDKSKSSFVKYQFNKGQLERVEIVNIKERIISEANQDSKVKNAGFNPSNLFFDVNYITTYSFDTKIKEVSNENSIISQDGKTVIVSQRIFDESDNVKNLSNKIFF